ncbi:hypothetical protein ABZT06_01610 [Streptomyces sp. NPDC005483]|uniref:hypothetical protein n=1 Tax=Streptomyces sp. NPDC005483 TaxID=3154882 RepID=UPI0033A82FC4
MTTGHGTPQATGPPRAVPGIVVAAEPLTDVDTTAADVLHALDEPGWFFPTVEAAVAACCRSTGAEWAVGSPVRPRGGR